MSTKNRETGPQPVLDPVRCQRSWKRLRGALPDWFESAPLETQRLLMRVLEASPYLAERLHRHPEWIPEVIDREALLFPRRREGLQKDIHQILQSALDSNRPDSAWSALRVFKEREQLRIATRDLGGLDKVDVLTRELSDLADACLAAALSIVVKQAIARFGQPWHRDPKDRWQPTGFTVLGLGKLGGQELNYASDVDLLFLYTEEGAVFRKKPGTRSATGPSGPSNHDYFRKIAEGFIQEVSRSTEDGQLYRVDTRLRPEGDAGPLVRSLGSYENYYAQWGMTWERLMLQKVRTVAGDVPLGAEFIETIQAFRYPRFVSERLVHEIAQNKHRLELDAIEGSSERDVKRGRGGIREVEFVVQTLQLLHAGRQPFLQSHATLPGIERLSAYTCLSSEEAAQLTDSYRFWRNVEHRLQMEHHFQTHALPDLANARRRIAHLMGFDSWDGFECVRKNHATRIRSIYERFLPSTPASDEHLQWPLPDSFDKNEQAWFALLKSHGFANPDKAQRLLRQLVHGPGWAHVSDRTIRLGRSLLTRFLALCPNSSWPRSVQGPRLTVLSDPDRVLVRLDSFITAYGTRAPLYETWENHPEFFELLLWTFDRSEYLAEKAIRMPDLLEEIVLSGRLRRSKSAEENLAELQLGVSDTNQSLWIRRYHQAEETRIGLRSILEMTDDAGVGLELSNLADACVQYALERVRSRRRWKGPGISILALGKLGGRELNFGSDLDLIFLTTAPVHQLAGRQKGAADLLGLLSDFTELGSAYRVDTRLRPDGEKGLLVNTLEGFLQYCRRRAQLWEIQTLCRLRYLGGEAGVFDGLQKLLFPLLRPSSHPENSLGLECLRSSWKESIVAMLRRIQRERTSPGQDELAIKTGNGGLIEAEFLAQILCLEMGWHLPNTRDVFEQALATGRIDPESARQLIESHRRLRHVETVLRRWSYQAESVLPADESARQRVAIRCHFSHVNELDEVVRTARASIRQVFLATFPSATQALRQS